MKKPHRDAEIIEHIRIVFEDADELEAHYSQKGWDTQLVQASAYMKLRKFLIANKVLAEQQRTKAAAPSTARPKGAPPPASPA